MGIALHFWLEWKYRSSRPEKFCKKGVLRNFAKFQENTCARVSFLIKLQAWNRWLLLKIYYTAFLAIFITITLDAAQKTASCGWKSIWCCYLYTSTMTTKTFKQTFTSRIGTFIWWYVHCSARGLHIARLKTTSSF